MSPIKHSVFLRTRDAYAACVPGIVDVPHVFAQRLLLVLDPRPGRNVFALWQDLAVVHEMRDPTCHRLGETSGHDVARTVGPDGVCGWCPLFFRDVPVACRM